MRFGSTIGESKPPAPAEGPTWPGHGGMTARPGRMPPCRRPMAPQAGAQIGRRQPPGGDPPNAAACQTGGMALGVVGDYLAALLRSFVSAIAGRPETLAAAGRFGWAVPVGIAVVGGISLMIGQSMVLAINRVTRLRACLRRAGALVDRTGHINRNLIGLGPRPLAFPPQQIAGGTDLAPRGGGRQFAASPLHLGVRRGRHDPTNRPTPRHANQASAPRSRHGAHRSKPIDPVSGAGRGPEQARTPRETRHLHGRAAGDRADWWPAAGSPATNPAARHLRYTWPSAGDRCRTSPEAKQDEGKEIP